MQNMISRRAALQSSAAAFAALSVLTPAAIAAPDTVAAAMAAMAAFTGGKEPLKGKIKLDLPEIAENGNTVPMGVSVDWPMTPEAYVQEVLVLTTKNPLPVGVTFIFTPESGSATATTHIRLGGTQDVIAIAKMSDGTFFSDTKNCKVTIGGCGG